MIFWIFVIIFVLCLILTPRFIDEDWWGGVLIGGAMLSGVVVFIMLLIIGMNQSTAKANIVANKRLYEALIYKSQTETIRDEFGIINKEYIDEIQDWNVDLAKYKTLQKDFWIGIFYPNIYDQFEFIELSEIKYKE